MKHGINSLLSSQDLSSSWKVFEKTLLVVVLLDLALGGNGYLVQIGGIRLRVILYAFCMAWAIVRLTRNEPIRIEPPLAWISIFFVAVTAFGTVHGYLAGYRLEAMATELKPLAYFPMLFFFLVTIRTREDLTLVARILVACGMLVAVLYLLLLLVAATGPVPRSIIRDVLVVSEEFVFRHNPFVGFLYKGAFYTCVAALFLLFDPFRITKLLAAVALVSVGMTLTRGPCLAIVICLIAGVFLGQKWKQAPLFVAQSALLLTVLFFAQQGEMVPPVVSPQPPAAERSDPGTGTAERNTEERNAASGQDGQQAAEPSKDRCPQDSLCGKIRSLIEPVTRKGDNIRGDDLIYTIEELDFSMVAIGRGIGAPIRGRDRIEMTYVEVFYKQGLPGLSVWLALFFYTFYLYLKVPRETKQFGLAFFLASLFMFAETASNNVLTGSIGMAVVFISIAALLVLTREHPRPMQLEEWYGQRATRLLRG